MDFISCIQGPKLFRKYEISISRRSEGVAYDAGILERHSDTVISCLRASLGFCRVISPVVMILLYRKGYLTSFEGLRHLAQFGFYLGAVMVVANIARAVSRSRSPAYMEFVRMLHSVKQGVTNVSALQAYDFDFSAWPVDFSAKNLGGETKPHILPNSRIDWSFNLSTFPRAILSYIGSATVGRWLVYPGSTGLMNMLIETPLRTGRNSLVVDHAGVRAKIETYDGNEIDTMFMDRRSLGGNGHFLVVCCEGNGAYYEVGCLSTPLNLGYSIMGWNHPGFGGSTGKPYPSQEHHAIDAVMQYAINKLNFPVNQIVLFSWSIGGYTNAWAAANYPDIKATILDATFDNIQALSRNRMPRSLEPLVDMTIERYFNLDVAGWLTLYNGPILFIRRTDDEMIATSQGDITTNRGNYLLLRILAHRYPTIVKEDTFESLLEYLKESFPESAFPLSGEDTAMCMDVLTTLSRNADTPGFPLVEDPQLPLESRKTLGLFLASKYMHHFESTHCVPLPVGQFQLPWTVNESD